MSDRFRGFTHKLIDVTFKLGVGSFGESGFNTVKLSGLRVSAVILEAGGPSMAHLQLRIWGLTLDKMNQLTTIGTQPEVVRRNVVIVEAGDAESGMSMVFQGTIQEAWGDFQSMPDVPFTVVGFAGALEAIKPIPVSSFRGSADVATIMRGLATRMDLIFENSGVDVKLSNPYFPGTARDQAYACAKAAGINIDIQNGKLSIWPYGQQRGQQIPLVSPRTGLIGYPTYTATGIVGITQFNPSIGFGQRIKVESDLKPACGEWDINKLVHNLESEIPGGHWQTQFEAAPPGITVRG